MTVDDEMHPRKGGPPTVVVLVTAGQGGTRLAADETRRVEHGRPVGDRTDDRNWKAGMFYVNRDDPALLVEKRFGIGYTLNFGHPGSWLLLVGIVVVPLVLR
jgi:uncharacterized membrane protein